MTSDYEKDNALYFANVRENAPLRTLQIHSAIVQHFEGCEAYLQDDDAPTGYLETVIALYELTGVLAEDSGPVHVVYRETDVDVWAYAPDLQRIVAIPYDTPDFEAKLFAVMVGESDEEGQR